jgi:hypothetical protein
VSNQDYDQILRFVAERYLAAVHKGKSIGDISVQLQEELKIDRDDYFAYGWGRHNTQSGWLTPLGNSREELLNTMEQAKMLPWGANREVPDSDANHLYLLGLAALRRKGMLPRPPNPADTESATRAVQIAAFVKSSEEDRAFFTDEAREKEMVLVIQRIEHHLSLIKRQGAPVGGEC